MTSLRVPDQSTAYGPEPARCEVTRHQYILVGIPAASDWVSFSVRSAVLWLQGTADEVCWVANAEEETAMFTRSPEARLQVVEGGQHFLSASDPSTVSAAAAEFIKRWA